MSKRSLENLGLEELLEVYKFVTKRLLELRQQDPDSFTIKTTPETITEILSANDNTTDEAEFTKNSKHRSNHPGASTDNGKKTETTRKQPTEDFQAPKRTCRRGATEHTSSLETRNSFGVLDSNEDAEMEEIQEKQEENPAPSTSRHSTKRTFTQRKPEKTEPAKGITPIIIRQKDKWLEISNLINTNRINYNKAKLTQNGVQVEPSTEDDYRNLYKILKSNEIQFHTFELTSEKPLKIVIRGIMTEIEEEDIKEDLLKQGYPTQKIIRMQGKHGPTPLVLVEVSKEYKSINELKHCCGLSVEVKPYELKKEIVQCHKCQLFGHVQRNCHAEYRCMKCGEQHSTHLCPKPKTTPPRCANCGEEHLSTSLRCEKNPNSRKNQQQQQPAQTRQTENPWTKRMATKTENTYKEVEENLSILIRKYLTTDAREEEQLEFINTCKNIIKTVKSA